jgi:hypothetical protein
MTPRITEPMPSAPMMRSWVAETPFSKVIVFVSRSMVLHYKDNLVSWCESESHYQGRSYLVVNNQLGSFALSLFV